MSDYSLQIKTTSNQGKSRTTTLSNVNPEATPATLLEFAQRLNLLTTNTYDQTDYVVKTTLDTETPPAPPVDDRQTPTVTLSVMPSAAAIASGQQINYTYTGDGETSAYVLGANRFQLVFGTGKGSIGSYIALSKLDQTDSIPVGAKLVFVATGTETYKPITVEFEIQA